MKEENKISSENGLEYIRITLRQKTNKNNQTNNSSKSLVIFSCQGFNNAYYKRDDICEKVAFIRRRALSGGRRSGEEVIVRMWRLLKVNRCWESSRCREKTIFKTLAAAVPLEKIDLWYQHQQNMKFLRWWHWKFMRWSWIF